MADYGKMTDWELGRRRQQLVQQMGEVEEAVNKRRAQDRHIMRKDELQWRDRSEIGMKSKSKTALIVDPIIGFNIHNMHAFLAEIAPGSQDGAYHMHGEAIKYYLSGRGIEIVGDKRYEVQAGDAVFIPAFTWHGTQNPGPDPLVFLAVTNNSNPVQKSIIFRIREDLKEG
ncbi:MAG TPA: cupin domain-containing protein [Dehalococcoidia bacterium]|nr:cupin domain-containing protein [Dehalococcoidia bacterium]